MSEEISQLKERVSTLQKNESDLQSSIRDLSAYKSKLIKEIAEFEIAHEQAESSLSETSKKLEGISKELFTTSQLLEQTKKDTELYIEKESQNRKKREVEIYTSITNLQDQEKQLKKTLGELQTRIDSLLTVEADARKVLSITENKVKTVNGDLVESQKLMSEYTLEIEKLKIESAKTQNDLFNILDQIEEKTPLLNTIEAELNKVTEERSKLEAEKEEFNKVIAAVNRQKEKVYQESLVLEKKFKQLGVPVKLT